MTPLEHQDAFVETEEVKRTVPQFVVCSAVAAALACAPLQARAMRHAPASVAGEVLNVDGQPQMGARVELLGPDATLVARAFTNSRGYYSFQRLIPGRYAVRTVAASYLPTLKENLRIRSATIVNVTVRTIYDLMQWTPAPKRVRPTSDDDWAWTLRSAESRPLLRWQEDGTPELVTNGSSETTAAAQHRLRMRMAAGAARGRFAQSGGELSMAAEDQLRANRTAVMSARAGAPDGASDAGWVETMLGFRQELGVAQLGSRSINTVAAMRSDPMVGMAGESGLQQITVRGWETMQLLQSLDAEAGSDQIFLRLGNGSSVVAAMPFAAVQLHRGAGELEYRLATARPEDPDVSAIEPEAWLPAVNDTNGQAAIERGLHQELGWQTTAGPARMMVVVYGDSIANPTLEAGGRLTGAGGMGQWMMVDAGSAILRGAGQGYSTTGLVAQVESNLPAGNHVRLSYASGDAMVMPAVTVPMDIVTILHGAHARHAQMYSLALSGEMDRTGTHWRASYRWQPEETVTEVAPYAVGASEPYLNLYLRQPIEGQHDGVDGRVAVLVDVQNLLAQGYQPFVTTDGSRLYFAQAQRAFFGGLQFSF